MGKNNIETLKEFQTSINIGFDLYDDESLFLQYLGLSC